MAESNEQQREPRGELVQEWSRVDQLWDIERLRRDLARIKGRYQRAGEGHASLSPTEMTFLRGLLLGKSPRGIARAMGRQEGGIKTDLSKTVYRYLKELLDYRAGARYPREQVLQLLRDRGYGHQEREPFHQRRTSILGALQRVLPAESPTFVGREGELAELLQWLHGTQQGSHLSVEGPGGIGKTALVRRALVEFFKGVADQEAGEAASRGAAGFPQGDGGEVSIRLGYVSAAQTRLMSTGAIAPLGGPRSLAGVLAIVGQQLDIDCDIDWGAGSDAENEPGVAFGISQGGGSQGWQQVYQFNRVLGQVPTVVVIENGETLPAEALEQWLAQLPQTVKVVVTSRERLALGRRLFLKPLELVTMERLIRLGGEQRGVPLSAQQQRRLVEIAQGIPLVAVHGLTRLALGNPLGTVLAELQDPAGGVMGFCVAPVIEALWRSPTERPMLLALERLPAGAMPHEVYDIAGLDTAAGERSWGTLIHHHLLSRRGHYWRLWPLARRYVTYLAERAIATPSGDPTLGRLGAALDERWLAWGQRWLAHYGDRDRWEWKDYGAVNEQWGNLERLMEWCVAGDRPETLWGFWVWLKGYTQFGGRAGLRKRWLSWVGAAFRARGNLGLAAAADFDLGFTYSDSDHPESLALAKTYFEQAWQLRDHCPLQLQADLIVNQCRLAVRQRETQAAQDWLAIGHQLVERLAGTSQGIDPDHERLWRRLELQLAYNQGELHMMAERWGLAQECYEQARDLAIAFQWKRAAVLSEGWIGDAIFRQGQWEEAEKILETTIRQAKEQGDRRCLALCQSTLAEIAQAQGRPRRACALAEKALVGFHDLGMTLEKEQSLQFLKELSYPPQKLEILLYGEGG